MTRNAVIGITLAAATLQIFSASAQAPSVQERAAALKQSLAANAAALRQYSWIETTTISLKGEVKKQEEKQCSYGADGKVVKTPMAGAAPQKKESGGGGRRGGGRVKEKIVENKVDELKDYMERAAALVHSYVPPDADKIQAAQAAGHVALQPGNNTTLTVTDYIKTGDRLAIGVDSAAKLLSSLSVDSYVDKPKDDAVTMAVTFGRLDDGTSYPQQILLNVEAKKVQVKVVNAGYKKK